MKKILLITVSCISSTFVWSLTGYMKTNDFPILEHSGFHAIKPTFTDTPGTLAGYVITERIRDVNCVGEPDSRSAISLGTCFIGMNSNGKIVGSLKYKVDHVQADGTFYYTELVYNTRDCTNTPGMYSSWLGGCTVHSPSGIGYKYIYDNTTSTPWVNYGPGLFEK